MRTPNPGDQREVFNFPCFFVMIMKIQSLSAFAIIAIMMGASAAAESRPNVVIFLADDAGWGDYSRNGNMPFLCYVPFTTPHSPWAVPEKNWDQFKIKR